MNRKYVHMFSSCQISIVNFQPSEHTIDTVDSWPWLCLVKAGLDSLGGLFQPPWFHDSVFFCCFTTQDGVSSIYSNTVLVANTVLPSSHAEILSQVLTQHRISSETWLFSKKSPNKPNQQNQLISFYLPTTFYHILSFAPAHKHWQNT